MNFNLTAKTMRKVPQVTALFWIVKLLTTAMGESVSDFMVHNMSPYLAVIIGFAIFLVAIYLQFVSKKYVAWIYWLAALSVAIFGTMAADVLHIGLGIPYIYSASFFAISLAIIFALWYRVEKTLSIHSIFTVRREIFYWATVMTTFALGTAIGDMTAITFNLGYLTSGILFAVLFAIPLVYYKVFKIHEVFMFWAAYIVTRPLGASFADWFGRTSDLGGVGFGTGHTSVVLGIIIAILVGYLSLEKIRPDR